MTDIQTSAETGAVQDKDTPIIFLDDVKVTFKTRTGSLLHPNKVQAIRGLTLKLMPGETLGIVGESGCGKSTTANVMCGLQKPTEGRVFFKGKDVTNRTLRHRKKRAPGTSPGCPPRVDGHASSEARPTSPPRPSPSPGRGRAARVLPRAAAWCTRPWGC